MPFMFRLFKSTFLFCLLVSASCKENTIGHKTNQISDFSVQTSPTAQVPIIVGANRMQTYLPLLKGKKVGLVANQTTVVFKHPDSQDTYTHLADTLLASGVNLVAVFAPEHGFRGTADAGEIVSDGKDAKTGLPIVSLYGDNKKPKPEQLKGLDILIFDLQDVGTRFYTYISTLHYVMEACAENGIQLMILDRPNPNGGIVDGPILDKANTSFVGMHPVPVLHGMTIGEYAQMINGEKWLNPSTSSGQVLQCDLKVVPCLNYSHDMKYSLPVKPSPNLPNDQAINLYASLCFFEGTNVSIGRGTEKQFQIYGSPDLPPAVFSFRFTPQPNEGAKQPMHEGKICYGEDLSKSEKVNRLELKWLIKAYQNTADKQSFFNSYFIKLAGTSALQQQIEAGLSEDDIRATWQSGLNSFKKIRADYLIYPAEK
jgi:uncharacterized protein YbbC (DUF1343 family)